MSKVVETFLRCLSTFHILLVVGFEFIAFGYFSNLSML